MTRLTSIAAATGLALLTMTTGAQAADITQYCNVNQKASASVIGSIDPELENVLSQCYAISPGSSVVSALTSEMSFGDNLQHIQPTSLTVINFDDGAITVPNRLNDLSAKALSAKLKNNEVLLLINADPALLGELTGVTLEGQKYAMVRHFKGHPIVEFFNDDPRDDTLSVNAQAQDLLNTEDGTEIYKPYTEADNTLFGDNMVDEQRLPNQLVRASLNDAFPQIESRITTSSNENSLPEKQVHKGYVTFHDSRSIDGVQTFDNNVSVEFTLLASHNPYNKYLRLVTMGAGFNPTSGKGLYKDNSYDRGMFHNNISLSMKPVSNNMTLETHSPLNVNGATTYTASSEVSVGVDVSENPGFSASYTISKSTSENISDFDIQNHTSGNQAKWDYKFSRTKDNKFNMFYDGGFMRKGKVYGVPNLAKFNLTPVSTAVWRIPGGDTGRKQVIMNMNAQYMHAWVTGNWASFTKHWKTYDFGINRVPQFDFSKVSS
ncbi:hypothetical protein [Veronia pacifica]|uniref:Leukocidin/Hemolysin toxin domain-containing protein n=1 Tax=Veronia pacifica TaxID=1080227 RepID=A0A1C3EIN1_9GAMM|nr:hypothetical protein [Veronia pacifica]ODA33087.1 hypothetical protein A8L45_11640 [Veronia pacifica]